MTWVQTYTGKRFELLDPKPEMVDPIDICVSLANQCRFSGHVRPFYSIAEHSVRVSELVSKEAKVWALLHDAAGAYLGDISRPVRRALMNYMSFDPCGLDELGMLVDDCIRARFGRDVSEDIGSEVEEADDVLLATETRDLMPGGPVDNWTEFATPLDEKISPWSRSMALMRFNQAARDLGLWDIDSVGLIKYM